MGAEAIGPRFSILRRDVSIALLRLLIELDNSANIMPTASEPFLLVRFLCGSAKENERGCRAVTRRCCLCHFDYKEKSGSEEDLSLRSR